MDSRPDVYSPRMATRIVFAVSAVLICPAASLPASPTVGPVRFSSSGDSVRITIETSGKVQYRAASLRGPERIYFDLPGAKLREGGKTAIPVRTALVKQIRMAARDEGFTRVVLDLERPADYAATAEPDSLIIDLRPAGTPPQPAPIRVPPSEQSPMPPPVRREPVVLSRSFAAQQSPVRTSAPAPAPSIQQATPAPKPESTGAGATVVEQIVAKINNEIITLGELERSRKQIEAELSRQKLPASQLQAAMRQAQADLLRDRIDQALLVQKAKDLNITVDQDLSKYMAQLQLESKITDPDKFQQYIREQSGMSFEDFKQQAKDSMLTRDVVRREVGGRIVIPKAELQKYYNEHKNEFVREEEVGLREILISTEGKDAAGIAAAEKKAKDLVARARKNENFGNLARDNSDAESARSYGELPPFKRGMLRKDLEDLLFTKEKGYVTDAIKQANGFLILKVEDHPQQGLQPFEAVENEVMEKLYPPRMQPAVRTYLTKLREEAFLEIREGYTDSGAAPGKDTSWKDPAKLVPATVTKEEVVSRVRHKRLLWLVPVPGTKPKPKP